MFAPWMVGSYGWGGAMGGFIPLMVIWSLVWKGLALWHAATRRQGWWFFALLVVNTMGILEIIYLFGVLKLKAEQLVPKKQ